ncbi:cyclic nucleotide-binding domain-containing protein [Bartonella sp. HY761]|uniref:cyclic nucleotide-binding domain-containing protein n=1 Tax=Bartonella sp. HY761 TaxID=2979330 RepID=UPI002203179F|nr:cyclic nucleotide-binding domain-containing protein [Bartonella sp. HY761]UXN05915.1 cyclic nucleotide-binding domain-containing protein [Bartonella sp. HY761]
MSVEEELLILKQLGFFQCFTDEQLRLVAFGAERVQFRAGRELFRENQPADSAFILMSGQIDLYQMGNEGPILVHNVMPGSMIGELSLICKMKRSVSAVAAEDGTALRVSRGIFRRILDEYPQAAKLLFEHLSNDFHHMVERLSNTQITKE